MYTLNSEQRVYVKVNNRFVFHGMLGPMTGSGHRYIFANTEKGARMWEVGRVFAATGELSETEKYGNENTRDAQFVLSAFAAQYGIGQRVDASKL